MAMRELLDGAATLTTEQKNRSWETVRAAIDAEPRRARRRRIKLVAVSLTGAAVVGATAATIVIASRPVTDRTIAECRSYTADGTSIHGTETSIATNTGKPGTITDAVRDCADLWRSGILRRDLSGLHIPKNFDGKLDGSLPVPPLVGCTRDDGAAVVVVGEGPQACQSAGYAPTGN
jgi:hypothetical protein